MATPSNPAMAAALARLWTRFLPEIENRVAILETAAASLAAGSLTAEKKQAAHDAAHKLAGTLGTFGLHRGTDLARHAEAFFAEEDRTATAQQVTAGIAELALLIKTRK
jgi:HPt (histidine-containing phosphotransfer) domain-containing protein